MSDAQPVVELRRPSRSFHWDIGLFSMLALGIAALVFFFMDAQSEAANESDLYKYKVHALLSLVNGAVTLGAIIVWLQMNNVLNRSNVQIKNGRIVGTVFDASENRVDLGIDELRAIDVERIGEQVVSLSLEHQNGAVKLSGFSNLDRALDAIRDYRPEDLSVREGVPRAAWLKLLTLASVLAAVIVTAATIYVRYHPYASMSPFSLTLLSSGMIKLDLLRIFMLSQQRKPNYRRVINMLYSRIFVFTLLTLATCVVINEE